MAILSLHPSFDWWKENLIPTSSAYRHKISSSSSSVGATAPHWARASSFTRFIDHSQRGFTVGRTPLDMWSAHRRDLYLTTQNTHNRHPSMPSVGFEPTVSAGERPQTYALDRAATGTGNIVISSIKFFLFVLFLLYFYFSLLSFFLSFFKFLFLWIPFLPSFSFNLFSVYTYLCFCYVFLSLPWFGHDAGCACDLLAVDDCTPLCCSSCGSTTASLLSTSYPFVL